MDAQTFLVTGRPLSTWTDTRSGQWLAAKPEVVATCSILDSVEISKSIVGIWDRPSRQIRLRRLPPLIDTTV
jgi:hypothetical protein